MSQFNGDKARFNRERKQNAAKRLRTRVLLEAAGLRSARCSRARSPAALPKNPHLEIWDTL